MRGVYCSSFRLSTRLRSVSAMYASRILPLDVACSGVRWPVQFCVVIAAAPRAWLMLIATPSSAMAMFTVSPSSSASERQLARPSFARSIRPVAAPASRTMPNPIAYFPRSPSCSTRPLDSRTLSSRDAVDLWTPSSPAISVMPVSPLRASSSSTLIARSTDCTWL